MKIFKNKKLGTTLIEVMVALFVVTTTIVGSVFIIQTSFNSAMRMRDNLIAQNLAREGAESVRKIVSTNLIKYSDPKCWRHPPTTSQPDCVNKYLNGNYKLSFSQLADAQFEVSFVSTTGGLKGTPPNLQLNPDFQLNRQGAKNEFISTDGPIKEKFHRIIEISYLNDDQNVMKIVSTVAWMQGEQIRELKMEEALYNNY